MADMGDRLREQIDESLQTLRTLADEVKVDVHLAGMEVRTRWERDLEPRITELESRAKQVTDASRDAIHDAIDRLRRFRSELQRRD